MDAATWRRTLQAERKRYLDLLRTHVSPHKMILFGSLAQDETKAGSDDAPIIL